MVITSKCGSMDNIITYEFICDTTADLQSIERRYVTMGSVAIVIHGDTGLEIYMADSHKQWVSLGVMNSGGAISGGPESNVVGEGQSGHMIIHDDVTSNEVGTGTADHMIVHDGAATEPTADIGQADNMVLSA